MKPSVDPPPENDLGLPPDPGPDPNQELPVDPLPAWYHFAA
nr:hypothetical protein [Arthrobacter sp. TB 26]